MRFDELVLKIPGDELHVRFHPRMTVLSGLGAAEREALAQSIFGALAGGHESTVMRYVDGVGRTVDVVAEPDEPVHARYEDDGSPAPPPIDGPVSSKELASLMLVTATDLGGVSRAVRDDEPSELREARASLEEITVQLEEAVSEEEATAAVRAELQALDEQLRLAHDGAARRQYAEVLAQLERVRAEAAILQSGTAGIDADRHLLANAGAAWDLAERWRAAAEDLALAVERFGGAERLDREERQTASALPDARPDDLSRLIVEAADAAATRAGLDHRLQTLAIAKLPAPSDPLVGELGLLEQDALWRAAARLIDAGEEMQRIQMSLGGLGGEEGGPPPAVIEEMEVAHADVEAAEEAAEAVRVPGVAGAGLGITIALAGTISAPWLILCGLLIAGAVGTITLVKPRQRVAKAAAVERATLERAGVPSYLGFHLRRVDAAVDPNVRLTVETASTELRNATVVWVELVGPGVDVHKAKSLDAEVHSYHAALRNLGGAADEIEQLRDEIARHAEPAVVATRTALAQVCAPYGLAEDELSDPMTVDARVEAAIKRGRCARIQSELEVSEAREQDAARLLGEHLLQLGFDSGDLEARIGALEWAVARAREREELRENARPAAIVEGEVLTLQETARGLKRPEWATVSPSEADAPNIDELEERRQKLLGRVAEAQPELDVVRLADRRAAVERRVTALEARHGDTNGDPGAVAEIQQHLLGLLTQAATAGPHGDPLPAVLDEVFLRVPAEHTWDLLDLLHRLAERQQLIYLSDDPFVGAWASQKATDLSLLAPEPEPV